MLPDPEALNESKAERQARVERTVREVVGDGAAGDGIALELAPGRRRSDLWLVQLRGPRATVLELPLRILDRLPHEDLELVSSTGSDSDYRLTLVVTLPLEQQPSTDPERRAKLRYTLGSRRG